MWRAIILATIAIRMSIAGLRRTVPSVLALFVTLTGCQRPQAWVEQGAYDADTQMVTETTPVDDWPQLPGESVRLSVPRSEPLPNVILRAAWERGIRSEAGVPFGQRWFVSNGFMLDDATAVLESDGRLSWEPRAGEAPMYWFVADAESDFTDDGIPDLHLHAWSGGAHCCYTHVILDGSDPARVHEIPQGHGEPGRFRRLADGSVVLYSPQTVGAYRWTSYSGALAFFQAWGFQDGRFQPRIDATILAHQEPIDAEALRKELEAHAGKRARNPTIDAEALNELLRALGTAIHGARTQEARTLIDQVWPANLPGEEEFRCISARDFDAIDDNGYLSRMHGVSMFELLGVAKSCR